ncbi:hypothetical protein [Ferroplasma sp.]|uniref:hypothetical protein n=1 Tax=Ferroplasma sp. TaxID=2591003 RepID=UPI002602F7AE|nr:hypothetical protein [Ferroplasma sp.]
MQEEMYTYENRRITGENGFSAEIIPENRWREISIEGSININLSLENGIYIIRHNYLKEGYVKKNSVMEYEGKTFIIDHQGLKNLKMNKINFYIFSGETRVAYVNVFRKDVNIDVDDPQYIIPVMIYIAILSKKLKTRGNKIYLKNRNLIAFGSMIYLFTGILSFTGLDIENNYEMLLVLTPIVILAVQMLYYILIKGQLF